jgi:hypothetical protein
VGFPRVQGVQCVRVPLHNTEVPHRRSRADTKDAGSGPEVQLGFGRVLYSRLCHTGVKNYEGLVFLGRQSGVIGHVLYG